MFRVYVHSLSLIYPLQVPGNSVHWKFGITTFFLHLLIHKKCTAEEWIKNVQFFCKFCQVYKMWTSCGELSTRMSDTCVERAKQVDLAGVRHFLGMLKDVGCFLPNLFVPFRLLLNKHTVWAMVASTISCLADLESGHLSTWKACLKTWKTMTEMKHVAS